MSSYTRPDFGDHTKADVSSYVPARADSYAKADNLGGGAAYNRGDSYTKPDYSLYTERKESETYSPAAANYVSKACTCLLLFKPATSFLQVIFFYPLF